MRKVISAGVPGSILHVAAATGTVEESRTTRGVPSVAAMDEVRNRKRSEGCARRAGMCARRHAGAWLRPGISHRFIIFQTRAKEWPRHREYGQHRR
jgi:hypothetical protein